MKNLTFYSWHTCARQEAFTLLLCQLADLGVAKARTVVRRARTLGIEMPIAEAVVALLDGRLRPGDAVAALMERSPTSEVPAAP